MEKKQLSKPRLLMQCEAYIQKHYTKEQVAQVHARLPFEAREALPRLNPSEWYPHDWASEFYCGVADLYDKFEDKEDAIFKLGLYIGEEATATFAKQILKMMTPAMVLNRFATFYSQYNNFGHAENYMEGDKHVVILVAPGHPWRYKLLEGWFSATWQAMGLKGAKIVHNMPPGQIEIDEIRYDVTWL